MNTRKNVHSKNISSFRHHGCGRRVRNYFVGIARAENNLMHILEWINNKTTEINNKLDISSQIVGYVVEEYRDVFATMNKILNLAFDVVDQYDFA